MIIIFKARRTQTLNIIISGYLNNIIEFITSVGWIVTLKDLPIDILTLLPVRFFSRLRLVFGMFLNHELKTLCFLWSLLYPLFLHAQNIAVSTLSLRTAQSPHRKPPYHLHHLSVPLYKSYPTIVFQ